MPLALVAALAASLGIHLGFLFGPDIELAPAVEPEPIVAELRQPPAVPAPSSEQVVLTPAKKRQAAPTVGRVPVRPLLPPPPAAAATAGVPIAEPAGTPRDVAGASAAMADAVPPPSAESLLAGRALPPRGTIRYRVERGDAGFSIGEAWQSWDIGAQEYRLHSVVETTGLAGLLRPLRMEMESIGEVRAEGLRPDVFGTIRDGVRTREKALFDWEAMRVRVGDRREETLLAGAQDLLSLYYQLGFLPELASGATLPVATGKKFGVYRLEAVGEEVLELPIGSLRCLHLRALGENTNEFWLAYDYSLLPVKIRHVDNKGGVLVQVAVEIQPAFR